MRSGLMTKVNGERLPIPVVADMSDQDGGNESGKSDFSGEKARICEQINGNIHNDEEIFKRYGGDGNCDDSGKIAARGILNCEDSGNDGKQKEGSLDDCEESVNLDREFTDIEVSERKVDVDGGEDEPSMNEKPTGVQSETTENQESDVKIESEVQIIRPHSQLPKPEAPPGLLDSPSKGGQDLNRMNRSQSLTENFSVSVDMPAFGKYIRERSNSLSAAIAKHISSLTENDDPKSNVTEFNLSGLKVIVKQKNNNDDDEDNNNNKNKNREEKGLKGRISFFARSNCRDCKAVRTFFRERGLKFVEINVDVYPTREAELIQRTGSSSVPQIFFNEKLFGGLVALNSLRNSGGFDERLREILKSKCPDDAPAPPVYGFDDPEEEDRKVDEIVKIVKILRQRLPIQDRLMKMKIVKNCFAGSEMVEIIIHHLDCGRRKAVEIGKEMARRHFIHHVFGEKDFEDGNHFYRFLEHEPFIPKCFNFRGSINDSNPKPAAKVGQRLTKIMSAILESYASEDRRHVDYMGISNSEEFRRYVNLAQDLHRVDILELSADEKLAFFLNLYNAMVIHAVIRIGRPEGVIDRRSFTADFQYLVGGGPYSLSTIKNGILRSNQRPPYTLTKPFGSGDKRLELALPKVNPLIHFGLCDGTRSSPTVRFFSPQGIEAELRCAAREFFQDGLEVDLDKRSVYLTRVMKWFDVDFGQERQILKWIMNYLDATKAGLLTHLLSDGGPIRIVYQNYDWSVNS